MPTPPAPPAPPAPRVLAVVPAAGQGTRLGMGPKAFVSLAGETLLARAVHGLHTAEVGTIVVAVSPEMVGPARELLATSALTAPICAANPAAIVVCAGGAERTDSVRNALAAVQELTPASTDKALAYDVVLVHDAARCLTPAHVIRGVIDAVAAGARAVIPVVPVTDTIKHVSDAGIVDGTPDRARLRAVQTPQGFAPATLIAAYDAATDTATDDAGLVERLGVPVHTVAGDARALKITTPMDMQLAAMILAAEDS